MDGAHQIIRAMYHGKPQLIITNQARLAVLCNALMPNLSAHAMSGVNRILPGPNGHADAAEAKSGAEISESGEVPQLLRVR